MPIRQKKYIIIVHLLFDVQKVIFAYNDEQFYLKIKKKYHSYKITIIKTQ